jgi:hypothetical protein
MRLLATFKAVNVLNKRSIVQMMLTSRKTTTKSRMNNNYPQSTSLQQKFINSKARKRFRK